MTTTVPPIASRRYRCVRCADVDGDIEVATSSLLAPVGSVMRGGIREHRGSPRRVQDPVNGGRVIARFEELDWQPTRMGDLTLRRRTEPATGQLIYEVKLG